LANKIYFIYHSLTRAVSRDFCKQFWSRRYRMFVSESFFFCTRCGQSQKWLISKKIQNLAFLPLTMPFSQKQPFVRFIVKTMSHWRSSGDWRWSPHAAARGLGSGRNPPSARGKEVWGRSS